MADHMLRQFKPAWLWRELLVRCIMFSIASCRFYMVQIPKRQGGKCRLLMTAKHRLPVSFVMQW